ncbi:DUF2238 domain-containing protein [Rhodohalobacter sp. 8-1]|uniref:DUF2238 domain-containing protein n=1 Tax=Rhodohalobacter sp. 8-1 TaxID=3131972 RepID=UPI0030EDAC8B
MTDKPATQQAGNNKDQPDENRLHRLLVRLLLLLMSVEGAYLLYNGRWLSFFLVLLIIFTLLAPILFRHQLNVVVPAEFHISAVTFSIAALYLGEVQEFYQRLWWWDIALHGTAGLLMGVIGFLMVYILNETDRVRLNLTPGFIAFFAFLFAIAIGTFWEIFEFTIDQTFKMNMQKPMLGDPSGLTDTMWDMIVNAAGAFIISITGWWYLKTGQSFFVDEWIRKFINRNPGLFKK